MKQIVGAKYITAGHEKHRGGSHVIGIINPDDIGIGKIAMDDRITTSNLLHLLRNTSVAVHSQLCSFASDHCE